MLTVALVLGSLMVLMFLLIGGVIGYLAYGYLATRAANVIVPDHPEFFDEDGNMFSTSGEDYLTLKYDRLVPLLVEGIKEQTEIIKTQQKEIDELKEMVKLLLNK